MQYNKKYFVSFQLLILFGMFLYISGFHFQARALDDTGQKSSLGASEPVIPGAAGFGIMTQAGVDGTVIRVTNLNSHGPGSLREAVEATGPRLVVFDVGGVIDLEEQHLQINEPYLAIAGQTAPSPGITLIKGAIYVHANDILIQHIRVRPGDAGYRELGAPWAPHAFRAFRGAFNVIVDHCSMSWAIEETCSASGPHVKEDAVISQKYLEYKGRFLGWPDSPEELASKNITYSNNIFSEALYESTMSKGTHSHGSLIGDACRDIAIIGNLYAHNDMRNPYFKRHTSGVIVNNLIYDVNTTAMNIGDDGRWDDAPFPGDVALLSIVGNVLIYGPSTYVDMPQGFHLFSEWMRRPLPMITSWTVPQEVTAGHLYLKDNLVFDHENHSVDQVIHEDDVKNFVILDEKPVWPAGLKYLPASELESHILKNAGARPWDRDEIDIRIVEQVSNRTGKIINTQDEVGGYPVHEPTYRFLEVPSEGRRQWLADIGRTGKSNFN